MGADYTPREVADLLVQGGVQVIDVREPDEFAAGRIAGAKLIPLGDLPKRVSEISQDAPLVLICRSGARSAMAEAALSGAGYDAHNMAGGMQDWQAAGLPLEPADGHVA